MAGNERQALNVADPETDTPAMQPLAVSPTALVSEAAARREQLPIVSPAEVAFPRVNVALSDLPSVPVNAAVQEQGAAPALPAIHPSLAPTFSGLTMAQVDVTVPTEPSPVTVVSQPSLPFPVTTVALADLPSIPVNAETQDEDAPRAPVTLPAIHPRIAPSFSGMTMASVDVAVPTEPSPVRVVAQPSLPFPAMSVALADLPSIAVDADTREEVAVRTPAPLPAIHASIIPSYSNLTVSFDVALAAEPAIYRPTATAANLTPVVATAPAAAANHGSGLAALIHPAAPRVAETNRVRLLGRPLRIVNASGRDSATDPIRHGLSSLGWSISRLRPVFGGSLKVTTIVYPAGNASVARSLARTLPFRVQLKADPCGCHGVQLVVGSDFLSWKPASHRVPNVWRASVSVAALTSGRGVQ
jgi:hypothetical protein